MLALFKTCLRLKKILEGQYSVLLLNQVVGKVSEPEEFTRIWNGAARRICVDGGTNAWHWLHIEDDQIKLPDIVSGDFDSIDKGVLDYMRDLENKSLLKVIHTPDQDETDFTKGLQLLLDIPQSPRMVVVITPQRTGRFDHFMSNINTLIKSLSMDARIYLYDFGNIIFAIPPGVGTARIELPTGTTCGLIPIDGPTSMKTEGLKWDLNDSYYFGGIVSSSNETLEESVTLTANKTVIFSAVVTL